MGTNDTKRKIVTESALGLKLGLIGFVFGVFGLKLGLIGFVLALYWV